MRSALLICTDLDRTLVPNGPQPESAGARHCFGLVAERPEVTLVYVSGRHRALVEEAITTYRLPVPDFVIGDVGTTIYRVGAERAWQRFMRWEEEIAAGWKGYTPGDLLAMLEDIPPLKPQEPGKQNRLKLSFYLPPGEEVTAVSDVVQERLDRAGIEARLVWSIDEIADVGLLDILPARASKRHAVEALMREQAFSLEQTVFCGDSGNDMEVLISPIPAVLVANSHSDIIRLAEELSREAGTSRQLYVATGGFMGMNGNYAGGMLEGIAHFYPRVATWLDEAGVERWAAPA